MRHAVCAAILMIAAPVAFASDSAPQSPTQPVAQAAAASTWVAKQGEATVDVHDVDAHMQSVPAKDRAAFIDSPKRIEQMLSHMLLRRNLANEARKLGLDKDAVMQRRIELAIEDVLMARRLEYISETITVPDLEQLARERYLSDSEKYRQPETVSVVHVLLNTADRTPQEAVALLEGWRKDVAAKKTTLEEVAKAHSDDPGVGTNGGLYADSKPESFVPEFAAAVAALKNPGDLSPPVKTEFGYHLIQLKERKAAHLPAYAEIKDRLVGQARERFLADSVRAHIEALRVLPIEASEESVGQLRDRYGKPAGIATAPTAAAAPGAAAAAADTPPAQDD